MKKLCIMAFTIALLAWSSISQANIVSATYTDDGSGALDSTAAWSTDNTQVTITGSQTSLPATTSLTFTTDTDADPISTTRTQIKNATSFAWTGYQIDFLANKAFTLSAPVIYGPATWSISVSQEATDGSEWELDASGATPIPVGGVFDFGYTLAFDGNHFWCDQTLSPLGSAVAVPEPGTLVLVFSGLLGLAVVRVARRRRA